MGAFGRVLTFAYGMTVCAGFGINFIEQIQDNAYPHTLLH